MVLWQSSESKLECYRTKAGDATRSASAKVLGVLATEVENMIVSSADLSNSDKTDGFLKKTHAFTKTTSPVHFCRQVFPN